VDNPQPRINQNKPVQPTALKVSCVLSGEKFDIEVLPTDTVEIFLQKVKNHNGKDVRFRIKGKEYLNGPLKDTGLLDILKKPFTLFEKK
jgi:hypothetical protein